MEVADPVRTSRCHFYLVRFCDGQVLSSVKWMEGTSLAVPWFDLALPRQGTWVSPLVRELKPRSGMAWPKINK